VFLSFKSQLFQVLSAILQDGRGIADRSGPGLLAFPHGLDALGENPKMTPGCAVGFESAFSQHTLEGGDRHAKNGGGLAHAV
jgi:hypothetical protein